jgi:4-amino-4-deoxy-L-arabinose transferase-like glycosyltransferase
MGGTGIGIPRPPRALAAVLGAVFIVGLAWVLSLPTFQAPDEHAHFAYTQSLAERFKLPAGGREIWSTEQTLAANATNADQAGQTPATKMEWSHQAYERWRRVDGALPDSDRSDGGGANPAGSNPPLYYLLEAGLYKATGGFLSDRLFVMRLGSLFWLLVTSAGAWLLAGEVFRRNRVLQMASASVAGLFPMVTFISSSLSPDGMLYALWTLALWLGARIVRRGLTLPDGIGIGAVSAAALLTKLTSYALLPAVAFAVVFGIWRLRDRGLRRLAPVAVAATLVIVVPLGGWLVTAHRLDRPATQAIASAGPGRHFDAKQLASYVWQYYLPKLPFQQPTPGLSRLPAYDVWLKTGWAAFALLEVRFPEALYPVFAAITLLIAGCALAALFRRRRRLDPWLLAFFAVSALSLLAGLHWTEYHQILSNGAVLNQGRYLFPLIGLAGLTVAQAVTLLPRRRRPLAVAVLAGALIGFQLLSLAITAGRFYA